ncbi:MAG: hypothetical protein MJ225_04740 [Bacilli bacterium]|nr:hypothetical protein [Bacilli bacterium]
MGNDEVKIKNDAMPEPKRRKKGRTPWWVSLITFFGGIVATIGGVAIFTAVTPVRTVVKTFGGDPDKLITESYQEQSLLALITTLASSDFDNLAAIAEFTPLIEAFLTDTLNPILDENLHFELDWDELKEITFTTAEGEMSIGDYIFREIQENVALADFISDKDSLKGVFLHFFYHPLYDEEGNEIPGSIDKSNPYTLKDYMNANSDFFNGIINQITIGDVIDTNGDPLLEAVKDWKISDFNQEKLKTLQISSFFKAEDIAGNTILETMVAKGWTLGDLMNADNVKTLKLKEVLNLSDTTPIVTILGEKTLAEIESMNFSETFKVEDVFPDSDSQLIRALYGKKLSELNDDTINNMLIKDVLPASEIENNKIIKALVNMNTTVGKLGENINLLKLSDVIDISGDPETSMKYKIVMALDSYTINEVGDHFEDLLVSQIFDTTSPTCNSILKALGNSSLANLPNAISNLTIGDCVPVDEDSPFNKPEILNTKISDSAQFENALKTNLTLKDVVDIDPQTSPEILVHLMDTRLCDIADRVKTITLGQMIVIDENSPQILKSLANVEVFGDIDNLESALINLKLKDVYDGSGLTSGVFKALWDLEGFEGGMLPIEDLPDQISNMKLTVVLEDKIYEEGSSDGKISGIWWYLLTESDEVFDGSAGHRPFYDLGRGKNYTVNDMDKLVSNITWHIQNENIIDLVNANVITVDPSLESNLLIPTPLLGGACIGDLTIQQFINMILVLVG